MAAQTCVHRLTQELKRLKKDPPQYIHVAPCPKNFQTWKVGIPKGFSVQAASYLFIDPEWSFTDRYASLFVHE